MTPTTPRQAREAAELYRDTGTTVSVTMVFSLADQLEKLTKERDEYKQRMQRLMRTQIETSKERDEFKTLAQGWVAENAPGGWIDSLRKERFALAAANKDLQDWFDALKADHDKLAAAAKMALEALTDYASIFENATDPETPAGDAINALKKAGVQ